MAYTIPTSPLFLCVYPVDDRSQAVFQTRQDECQRAIDQAHGGPIHINHNSLADDNYAATDNVTVLMGAIGGSTPVAPGGHTLTTDFNRAMADWTFGRLEQHQVPTSDRSCYEVQ